MGLERIGDGGIAISKSYITIAADKKNVRAQAIERYGVAAGKGDLAKPIIVQKQGRSARRISRKVGRWSRTNRIKTRRAIRREGKGDIGQVHIRIEQLGEIIGLTNAQGERALLAHPARLVREQHQVSINSHRQV